MAIHLDNVIGLHENALHLQSRRAQMIAQNLANSDTPGYQARDIDFKSALKSAANGKHGPLANTQAGHIQPGGLFMGAEIMYRQPMQPSIDGNTVEPQIEMAEFADNSMRYLTSLRFINGRIQGMLSALRGE